MAKYFLYNKLRSRSNNLPDENHIRNRIAVLSTLQTKASARARGALFLVLMASVLILIAIYKEHFSQVRIITASLQNAKPTSSINIGFIPVTISIYDLPFLGSLTVFILLMWCRQCKLIELSISSESLRFAKKLKGFTNVYKQKGNLFYHNQLDIMYLRYSNSFVFTHPEHEHEVGRSFAKSIYWLPTIIVWLSFVLHLYKNSSTTSLLISDFLFTSKSSFFILDKHNYCSDFTLVILVYLFLLSISINKKNDILINNHKEYHKLINTV